MGSLSKEAVAEAIRRQGMPEAPAKVGNPLIRGARELAARVAPDSAVARAALRDEYMAYVDAQQSAGQEPLAYEQWVRQR